MRMLRTSLTRAVPLLVLDGKRGELRHEKPFVTRDDLRTARHGPHRVYRREELSRVVLFSDGFSGQREALLGAEEPCLQELYRQLRQREAADSRCNRYPRLKPGDDASGIVAVF